MSELQIQRLRSGDSVHSLFEKGDERVNRGNIQIRFVTIGGGEVRIRLRRTDRCGLLEILKREFIVVIHRISHLKHIRHPHERVIGEVRKFLGEFLAEKTDLVRGKGMVPEELAIELNVLQALTDRLLKSIEDFVEFFR